MNERAGWANGLACWTEGDTAYLSIAFTWRIPEAYSRALMYRAMGYRVRAGGPALFVRKHDLEGVAELGGEVPDAIVHHHPQATIASRGCPVGCWFCIVPKMEGKEFTLLPDFVPRPILCDNNLSALPDDYQRYIIERYVHAGLFITDANSGFEPRTFGRDTFLRWNPILRGPWRFAFDEMAEWPDVERTARILRDEGVTPKRMRIYVLVGNEPVAACLERINRVIAIGGEPYVQPYIKLNALERRPKVRFDWTEHKLLAVARWANWRVWRYASFEEYDSSVHSQRRSGQGPTMPLFERLHS